MDTDERFQFADDDKDRRYVRGCLILVSCVLLGILLGGILGSIPGLLIVSEAPVDPPAPHGGMYAALGAWLIFIPLGAILGLVAGLVFGLILGAWIARKRTIP